MRFDIRVSDTGDRRDRRIIVISAREIKKQVPDRFDSELVQFRRHLWPNARNVLDFRIQCHLHRSNIPLAVYRAQLTVYGINKILTVNCKPSTENYLMIPPPITSSPE